MTNRPLGLEISRGENAPPRSVIGEVTTTPAGNTAIRIGREMDMCSGGWHQTEYVVLTDFELGELHNRLWPPVSTKREGEEHGD